MARTLDPLNQPSAPPAAGEHLGPGAEVEVWCRSLGKWVDGFELITAEAGGWRVRRLSDRSELPVRFGAGQLRRCPTRS